VGKGWGKGRGWAKGRGRKGNRKGKGKGGKLAREEDVQASVRQMLRGIRGYIDANYVRGGGDGDDNADGGTTAPSLTTPFASFHELDDATAATPRCCSYTYTAGSAEASAETTRPTAPPLLLPRDRYFTFRVEFARPISAAQLPPALDAASEEFGTVPSLGRVLGGEEARVVEPPVIKAAADRGRRMGRRWALGRVRPADGVEVGFDAFCEDPDDVDDDGGDDDDTTCTAELGRGENTNPERIPVPPSPKGESMMKSSYHLSHESSKCMPGIAIGQSVLAYPHKGKNDEADAVEQALSCTVVDTRFHEEHGRQYKVEFDSRSGLEHPKQWMSTDRIVVVSASGGGGEGRKRKEVDCSNQVKADDNDICRQPKKRTRVLYHYISKPIRFKL